MASSIGIKIANGEFYPVLEEGSSVKKRLILTTVHDGQRSVQIDLYRSESRSMADAAYIGSLVVENIGDKPRGEPSIELVIGADGPEELSAEAVDLDATGNGDRQHLSVSLQALDDTRMYEVPDFELEGEPPSAAPSALFEEPEEESRSPSSFPVVPVVVAAVAVLLLLAILFWFIFMRNPTVRPRPAAMPAKTETSAPAAKVEPAPAAPAPAKVEPAPAPAPAPAAPPPAAAEVAVRRARPVAPVKSYKVPNTIPKAGFRYRIRWGDTLWDISEAFYRNPWLYPRIARFNSIRNPDLIISGTSILVPPKN